MIQGIEFEILVEPLTLSSDRYIYYVVIVDKPFIKDTPELFLQPLQNLPTTQLTEFVPYRLYYKCFTFSFIWSEFRR